MTISELRDACMEKYDKNSHFLNERAKNNIERHRKREHSIRLIDKNGEPIAGARIKITQISHDFKYGANIFMLDEFKEAEINRRYRDTFSEYFNLATVPFFWEGTEPEQGKLRYDADSEKMYRRPPTDLCVEYCEEKGILPKLHCLFYDKIIPDWLPKNDSAEMWRLYEKRFAEIAERYSGRMYEFEATNELISAYFWKKCSILANEKDIGIRMWEMARRYFPNETLVINDTTPASVVKGNFGYPYYLMIKEFLSKGASIDKIGGQHHIFSGVDGTPVADDLLKSKGSLDPEIMIQGLERMAEFGKPLEITEVTIPTVDDSEEAEQLQAEMLRELYTLWFATPRMESVVYWNVADFTAVVDGDEWDENRCRGGLFNYDMTPKRSALELKRLFTEEWHTEEELVSDEQGVVRFRGFFGDYKASVGNESFNFGLHRAQPTRTTHQMFI